MKRLIQSCLFACALLAEVAFAASPTLVGTPVGVGSSTSGNTASGGTGSYTIATGGDDLIIILAARATSTYSLSSITTSSGSLTTDLAFSISLENSNYIGSTIYRIHGASAESYTITVTWSKSISQWGMILAEGSGISAVDGTVPPQGVGYSTAAATGSITTSDSGDLVIAAAPNASGGSGVQATWTSPFTAFVSFSVAGIGMEISAASYTQPSAGAVSAAATYSTTELWVAPIVAYSGSASATCTHEGYTSGGALAIPNGTSGSYLGSTGGYVTPDCATVKYWEPALGNFGVN